MPRTHRTQNLLAATLTLLMGMTTACGAELEVDGLELEEGTAALSCEAGVVTVVPRAQWGARPARSTRPRHTPDRITIHHTVQGDVSGTAAVRAVQNIHMDDNGWADVGYHFIVDRDGTIYEGNPELLVGAHVASQNTGNLGIAMVGSFDRETLDAPQKRAVAALVNHLASRYSIPITRARVKGHGERLATACPGDVDLDELVRLAADGPRCDDAPAVTTLDPIEVYWARLADGSYKLHAIAGARVARVTYHVDGFEIGESDRSLGANFPDTYRFRLDARERLFEAVSYTHLTLPTIYSV